MDKDWAEALDEEYGTNVAEGIKDDEEEVDEEVDTGADDDANAAGNGDNGTDEGADEGDENDKDSAEGADSDDDAAAKNDDEEEQDPDSPPEKFAPKDAIKEALRELDQEREVSTQTKNALKNEVLETLYPEGIDRQLLDSKGEPIKTIEDVQNLINPDTGDYFTEDEAGAWLLNAQQTLNKNIEQLEDYADTIVDTNLSLKEGAERVEELYGELLNSIPDVAEQVFKAYEKTLIKDPKSGIVLKAPVDVVEFYGIALSGYKNMAEKMNTKKEQEDAAKKAADLKAAKARQAERADLPRKSSDGARKDKGDDEWLEAYDSYFNE